MPLNNGQQKALNTILEGHSVFLTGPGGTGKSFLVKRIVEELKLRKKHVSITALTGCAALLHGRSAKTIHSWAGIGLGKEEAKKIVSDIRKLPWKKATHRRWLLTNTLIIDEISMMTPDLLKLLDTVAREVRREHKPFGGIQVIFVGDFFQLPPIVKVNEYEEKVDQQLLFESDVWKDLNLKVCCLNEIVRQQDPVFQKILSEARFGTISSDSLQILQERQNIDWNGLRIKPTLLFPRRAEVEKINKLNLKALMGKTYIYEAQTVFDASLIKGLTEKSPEVLRAVSKLDRDAPYNTSLELKVGSQVMLIFNLDQEEGLVNGSRGVIEGFTETIPPIPMVLFKGQTKAIPVIVQSWESEELEGVKRVQIPLILAFANSIHKVQGATIDCALIDIGPSIFEVGQAYVALSRVKSLDSLYIYNLDPLAFKTNPKVIDYYSRLEDEDGEGVCDEVVSNIISDDPINC
jgi:ATP-dependent DNA helicase PIF1